jgi:hypothetical protein
MTDLIDLWSAYVCPKHGSIPPTNDAEIVHSIAEHNCPSCPGEKLEPWGYEIAGREIVWSRCPCCGVDWAVSDTNERGWIGLGAIGTGACGGQR